ncbi:uncharacterized protein LOC123294841 [Chrysoperla carnea]|uniref:uncharacterized protein LOC123294841 n=1 Tax=Chrysoperla carnea TaxID=189513 RepID=UPI001D064FEB|nr:uncharacterized protein LOC123294841 [Chrysoperla carnea]
MSLKNKITVFNYFLLIKKCVNYETLTVFLYENFVETIRPIIKMNSKNNLLTIIINLLIICELFSVVICDRDKNLEDLYKTWDDKADFEKKLNFLLGNNSGASLDFLLNFNHEIPIREAILPPYSNNHHNMGIEPEDTVVKANRHFDPWSIVWYVGSFGGLVIFFLVVSCSEWCCRRDTVANSSLNNRRQRCRLHEDYQSQSQHVPETPPPAYHLFAPPAYESVYKDCVYKDPNPDGVFVVPVHHGVIKQNNNSNVKNSSSTIINIDNSSTIVPR